MQRRLLQILIFLFFILATLHSPVDLDLGWHLRYGQYFFQTGHVLRGNIISYVWPDYKWVQASWGYDLLVYQIFTHLGFFGLTLSATILTLIIFWLITRPVDRFSPSQLFLLAVVFLSQTAPLYYNGLRSQTPSTLFFAIVLIITDLALWPGKTGKSRYLFLLPIVFLVWANLHGGFPLGLLVAGLFWSGQGLLIAAKRLRGLKIETVSAGRWFIFGVVLVASAITPLVNPWGIRIYEETFRHSTTMNLTGIAEWQPLTVNPVAAAVAGLVLILVLGVAFIRKKLEVLPFVLAFIPIALLAFGAIRFLIPFGIMAVYFLAASLPGMKPAWGANSLWRFWPVPLALLVLLDLLTLNVYFTPPELGVFNFSWESYCGFAQDCSEGVTRVMSKDPPAGNGYNPYNYGGYLSWRVPRVKTFVDGRMAAWAEGDKTPPLRLADGVLLGNGALPFRLLDNAYHFNWIIIQTQTDVGKYLNDLAKSGRWVKKYQDPFYSYFVKQPAKP